MRITSVTTRVGDGGETYLGGGQKVPKDSPRVEAYGNVDELNSLLGLVLSQGVDEEIRPWLERVQHELFRLGSELCFREEDKREHPVPGIEDRHVERLDEEIRICVERVGPLEEFILPAGHPSAALLHVVRTVCRRAERGVVTLSRSEPVAPRAVVYLNRLGDWLFVLARRENQAKGQRETLWRKDV
jgi:cob(I)alamin adenosyltransferase